MLSIEALNEHILLACKMSLVDLSFDFSHTIGLYTVRQIFKIFIFFHKGLVFKEQPMMGNACILFSFPPI